MAKQPKRPELTDCKVTKSTNPSAPWRVFFTTDQDGRRKRVFKSFASEDKAWMFAVKKDLEISNHGARFGDITPEARRAFDHYRDESAALREMGATVPNFEVLVMDALAGIRDRLQLAEENQITVADALAEFLAYKGTRVGVRQLADLTDRLGRFSRDHGDRPIGEITTADVEQWLASLRSLRNPKRLTQAPLLGPLARNHYRAALRSLFEYATAPARGWCQRNVVADLEPEMVAESEPQAYTPEDVKTIMQAALDHKPALVPVLALGFFAGLRVSEAIALDLTKLTKDATEFRVTGGKTGSRVAMFGDTCKAWYLGQPRRKGKAWEKSARTLVDEVAELFTLAKVEQIDNGARHSYISYKCAKSKDVAAVSDEVGNSVGTIKKHYRSLVPTAAAKVYFAIRPAKPANNIVPMTTTPAEVEEAKPTTRRKAAR